jgi:hypothetical protein
MKTNGGFKIENFHKLENEVSRGNLQPLIYKGLVELPDGKFYILWDKNGMCSNHRRSDCFITIK